MSSAKKAPASAQEKRPPHRKIPPALMARAVDLVDGGATVTQAAEACGVSISGVSLACGAAGVVPPSKKRTHAIRARGAAAHLDALRQRRDRERAALGDITFTVFDDPIIREGRLTAMPTNGDDVQDAP